MTAFFSPATHLQYLLPSLNFICFDWTVGPTLALTQSNSAQSGRPPIRVYCPKYRDTQLQERKVFSSLIAPLQSEPSTESRQGPQEHEPLTIDEPSEETMSRKTETVPQAPEPPDAQKDPRGHLCAFIDQLGIDEKFALKVYKEAKLIPDDVTFLRDIPEEASRILVQKKYLHRILRHWTDHEAAQKWGVK